MDEDKPQSLIPATSGIPSPTAGHSYSTRSKVKRTSHCEKDDDDDSSGSQGHQPPLKRQTILGPNQAETTLGSNNDDATADVSNAVEENLDDENIPAQTALQNDLVLETLFRCVKRSDLLSCRAVNKQWEFEATKELRRRKLVIKFAFYRNGNEQRRNSLFRTICRRLSECRTPQLLSSFQVQVAARNELGSAGVGSIFTTVRVQLKILTLHLNYLSKRCSFERSSLITHLHNLLYRQAPNLEFLEIKFDSPDHWKDAFRVMDIPDRLRRLQNEHDHNEFLPLPNLRTFVVSGSPPPGFVADVVNAGVNLSSFGGAWSAWSQYLMGAEGRAKIHQLKSLMLSPPSIFRFNYRGLQQIETFVTEHRQNLKLETFECVCVSELFRENASSALRIVILINQILDCSSESLKKLRIEPAKWYNDRLVIPRLPNLKEISFDCYKNIWFAHDDGGLFPRGFNMNYSFPNVSSIVILKYENSLFCRYVSRMEMEITEPVLSVRYMTLMDMEKGAPLPTVTDFRRVFPDLVSVSYVDSDKYYKI